MHFPCQTLKQLQAAFKWYLASLLRILPTSWQHFDHNDSVVSALPMMISGKRTLLVH
jgi:hypothetical protein